MKDRASLVNAAALQGVLGDAEDGHRRLWLVPSLLDGRLRLRDNLGMHEFLRASAAERGYQVAPVGIAKSPKVESLATGLTSRIYPVLTHARGTQVHGQFKQLAEFVLERLTALAGPRAASAPEAPPEAERPRLLAPTCPLCAAPAPAVGCYFQARHSRHRGLLHAGCLARLSRPEELAGAEAAVLVLELAAEGEPPLQLLAFAADGSPLGAAPAPAGWDELLFRVCDRQPEELFKERLLIGLERRSAADWRQLFPPLRRRILAAGNEPGIAD